jgi:putative ribosome biogenesis GTPase RsgA
MISELIERLQKCPEWSCSRCQEYGTPFCAVREAVQELKRFDHVLEILNEERGD